MERDPVCGMNVDPEKAKAKVEHGGKSYYFCSAGCAQKFELGTEKYLAVAAAPVKTASATVPSAAAAKPALASLPILASAPKAKDLVCGMMVDLQKAAAKAEHAGKTYHFCSPRCAERFEKEPEKFLAAPGTAGMEHAQAAKPPAGAQGIRYTCPMHPEIVQIGPGNCPICGMALEPMDIVAEEQSDPEYDSMRKRLWVGVALSLPLLALSIPLLDVSLSVLRRFLRKQPIFAADREHIHHRLLDRGLSPRQAVWVLYLVAAIGAAFALVASAPVTGKYQGFLVLLFCFAAAVGIRQLRYRELDIPGRLLFRGMRQKLAVERLASILERAGTEEDWWDRLAEAGSTLGLVTIRLGGREGVRHHWRTSDQMPAWSFQVTLPEGESLQVEGSLRPGAASFDLIRFAEIVKSTFPGNRMQPQAEAAGKVASALP